MGYYFVGVIWVAGSVVGLRRNVLAFVPPDIYQEAKQQGQDLRRNPAQKDSIGNRITDYRRLPVR